MKTYISLFFKGLGMGAANVIPGVSGGTIALITGIFERLINAIKSFNLKALKLLLKGDIKELIRHTDLYFLIAVLAGVAISILSLAHLLDFLFKNYPVYIWSFFFGLILASVYFVGRTIDKWNIPVITSFMIGTGIAIAISVLTPASENTGMLYLFICGIVAACSMILPGLSGSFVLILMGNYQLVMIDAVNTLNLKVLLPVVAGAGVGLLGFSYILSWVFERFRNQTIAILTGFILGSLGILWPWKNEIYKTGSTGELILKSSGEKIVEGYHWFIPEAFNHEVILAIAFALVGIVIIWLLEKLAAKSNA
ncbi:DUF368 domain-containing protein [Saccharicrinis sp. FJH62]|uniref:DUF368 domain-containing protein n=1 Tax=Saccharicrinis sp. FJH62 TaxID=3344657 RepID=UPI0035D526B3